MDNEKFGKFIKDLRKLKNLTQKELGEKVGVTDKAVSKWERGHSFPDITMINTLADALGITTSELLNAELGKKEEIDVDKAVKEAIEKYKDVEGKRKKRLKVLKRITIVFSILLFSACCSVQAVYLLIAKKHGYEFVFDTLPYILNEMAIITGILSIGLIIRKSKIKNIMLLSIAAFLSIINMAFLFNDGLDNKCIVSISKRFENEFVLKVNKKTGEAIYYRDAKYFIFAKPKETLEYEVKNKVKCQWLETDICSVTYKDRGGKLQCFVATYGSRDGKYSGYHWISSSIEGTWKSSNQNSRTVTVKTISDGIRITRNGKQETFKYENCKQFGVIAFVLYNEEGIPRYVIGLNKNCKFDNETDLIKERRNNYPL